MAVKEEIRPSRSYTAVVEKSADRWKEIHIGPEDVPALSKLDEKYLELVRLCQSEVYEEELHRFKKGKQLHSTSSLLALAPILGSDGVLRLGGRAGRAKLPYDQLHPPPFSWKPSVHRNDHPRFPRTPQTRRNGLSAQLHPSAFLAYQRKRSGEKSPSQLYHLSAQLSQARRTIDGRPSRFTA
jgi:hypothetical protein